MADSYSRWVMTDAFANNSQAAINAGQKIEWVAIKTSDDSHTFNDLSGFNDTTLVTATIRQTTNISSVTITGKTVTITGLFNSKDNRADYYIRTMFLVARYNGKEFLAGATVANSSATAFRMPAASGTEITEFTARPQISVSNTSTISATVNPVASATNERVDSLEADTQAKIDYLTGEKDMLWDRFKDFVTKATAETINGAKTFTQIIVGSITGNAGTATKLQTGRRINGTVFDGTSDINVPASNDSNLVHKTGAETIAGTKRFTEEITADVAINGRLSVRGDIQSDLNTMNKYAMAGVYGVGVTNLTNQPVAHFGILENIVLPSGTTHQKFIDIENGDVYFRAYGSAKGSWSSWSRIADDATVIHVGENAASATKLKTIRRIGGVNFDGTTDINLPGVNTAGNQNTSGNAATATKLQTGRLVGGVLFDGTSNITLPGVNAKGNQDTTGKAASADVLNIRGATFTDISVVTSDMITYAGNWLVNSLSVSGTPSMGYAIMEVLPVTGNKTAGIIRLSSTEYIRNYIGVVKHGSKLSWVPLPDDSKVVHKTGAEIIAGAKRFTEAITADVAINGMFATRTDAPSDLNMMNTYGATGIYGISLTNLANQPVARPGILHNIVLPSGSTHQKFIDIENGDVYFRAYGSAKGSWSSWSRIADDGAVIHVGENAASATKLQTARLVGGVSFDGTQDIVLPGVNAKGNQDTSGRAANADLSNKAVALNTPRKINGTNFDGTADINVNAANDTNLVHKSGAEVVGGDKEFTGTTTLANVTSKNVIKKSMTLNNIILDFAETASGVVVYVHSNGRSFLMDSTWHDAGTLPAGITPPPTIVIADSTEPAGIVGITTRMGFNIKISISPTGKIGYKLSSLLQGDTTARTADVSFDAYTSWFK